MAFAQSQAAAWKVGKDPALFAVSKARPEPADSAEEADCTIKLGQPGPLKGACCDVRICQDVGALPRFQQVLEQFRKKCTNGTAEALIADHCCW